MNTSRTTTYTFTRGEVLAALRLLYPTEIALRAAVPESVTIEANVKGKGPVVVAVNHGGAVPSTTSLQAFRGSVADDPASA